MKNKGFTLIELIVVITILAILGTIAFIGFKGYTSDARDSKVTTDIANLHNVLAILKASDGTVPMPDSSVTVKSGTTDITYEGEVGDNVRNTLKASSDAKTPSGENYKYAVNGTQKDFTLVGELENDTAGITTNAFAEGEANTKYFKGDEVLTLFNSNNDFIGGDVDGAISGITKAYIGEKELSISSDTIQNIPAGIKTNDGLIFKSCKLALDSGMSKGDGYYNLKPKDKVIKTYCDMTNNGGGWTLVYGSTKDAVDPKLLRGKDWVDGSNFSYLESFKGITSEPKYNFWVNADVFNSQPSYNRADLGELNYIFKQSTAYNDTSITGFEAISGTYDFDSKYDEFGNFGLRIPIPTLDSVSMNNLCALALNSGQNNGADGNWWGCIQDNHTNYTSGADSFDVGPIARIKIGELDVEHAAEEVKIYQR